MTAVVERQVKRLKLFCVESPALKARVKRLRNVGLRALSGVCGPGIDHRATILGYHSVGDGQSDLSIPREGFRRHVEWLVRHGYRMLTLRQLWAFVEAHGKPPARSVVLTFDDGFRGVVRHAAPVLAEHGVAATVFLVTDYIGKTNAYDRPLAAPELPLMDWDEVERLKRLGWDIQSHGKRHLPLVQLEPSALDEELAGSKRALEQRLGDAVEFFCYPHGAFDGPALAAVARAGYLGALTCRPGTFAEEVNGSRYRLPRSLVDGCMSQGDFSTRFRRGFFRVWALAAWLRARTGHEFDCPFDELHKLPHRRLPT
ncbi:MAG: polysaccharide deacetylase family protein [Candidatus Omnitrophica bacterium]|nr:polysaccharide deacetylase family protein [Candidatus Omnitrophota bacterium]